MKDINLLPEDVKEAPPAKKAEKTGSSVSVKGILITLLVLLVMGGSIVAPKAYIMFLEKNIEGVRAEINGKPYQELRNVNSQLAEAAGRIDLKNEVLADIEKHSYPVTQAIASIKNVVPRGCYISSFGYDNGTISINGYAENSLTMVEFFSAIDRLQNIKRDGGNDSMSFEKLDSVYSFKLSLKLAGK